MFRLVAFLAAAPLLAAPLASVGCLYLDGINESPEADLRLESAQDYIFIGSEVTLTADDSRDPDGDELVYHWSVEQGGATDAAQCDDCPGFIPESKCCFIPTAKVVYRVTLWVEDQQGARSQVLMREISVNNRPPEASARITTLPKPENNHFILGREIWVFGGEGESSDPDAGDEIQFHWEELSRPPASSTAAFVFEPCDANRIPTSDPARAEYLRVVPDVAGTYEVGLRVSDGEQESNLYQVHIEVDADEEPCIEGTSPDHSTGALVFDRVETRRLEVTAVTDDLDPYPGDGSGQASFRWLIEEEPGTGFLEVPGYGFSYLDVNGSEFALGQLIRARVIIDDRAHHDLSACPVEQSTCALRAGCFQWVTWEIEFR